MNDANKEIISAVLVTLFGIFVFWGIAFSVSSYKQNILIQQSPVISGDYKTFQYNDHVKVLKGFYDGCSGHVTGLYNSEPHSYIVDLAVDRYGKYIGKDVVFESNWLEKIK